MRTAVPPCGCCEEMLGGFLSDFIFTLVPQFEEGCTSALKKLCPLQPESSDTDQALHQAAPSVPERVKNKYKN